MNTVNPATLLRSLIVYAIIVPLAILVGYLLANQMDYQTLGFMSVLGAILVFPLLMKWHYPLLMFSCLLPATLFFLPGHPSLFMFMTITSLGISVVERIMDRNQPFLPATAVRWPLLLLLAVVLVTAKMTGGFGVRALGSEIYGGKKYVTLIVGILSFFAMTARPIPKKQANFYITLYFAGGFFSFIQDLYAYVPESLHFIFAVFPPSDVGMNAEGGQEVVLGQTRLAGIASAAGAVFYWMLARNGFRDNFLTGKIWRPLVLGVMLMLVLLGGFRSSILGVMIIVGLLFWLEKMYRTGAMAAVILATVLGGALLVPLASHLPYTFQRSLAFLPLDIDPEARMNAESSTDWRLEIWKSLLPQIPKYLLLGKGYAFSAELFSDSMGQGATFKRVIDPTQDSLVLSSDYHNGPLSVILTFGIWGVLAWLWYLAAGFYVVWRNYHHGDPALRHLNLFLFAMFMSKAFGFFFIFGDIVGDTGGFAALIGLSIALNHGVMSRQTAKAKAEIGKAENRNVQQPNPSGNWELKPSKN